jgi:hypothetical protein
LQQTRKLRGHALRCERENVWRNEILEHHSAQTGRGAHPASYTGGTGAVYAGVKRLGLETDRSPLSSADVKNGGAIPGWGTYPASYTVSTGAVYAGVKRLGRETDRTPPSSAYVKNGGAVPLLPHTSPLRGA